MTFLETATRIFHSPARLIKLKGYTGGNRDYNEAKKPVSGRTWIDLTLKEAEEWNEAGGWIGAIIPEGCILIDIDDKVCGKRLYTGLKRLLLHFTAMLTPNGYQIVFADIHRVETQAVKILSVGGVIVDYRLQGKGYTVLPTTNTEGRRIIHEDSASLSPMPSIFIPVRRYDEVRDQNIVLPEIINMGQRNDLLFRHACRLRSWDTLRVLELSEDEQREIIEAVNITFCEQPLSSHEIRQIIASAERYEKTVPDAQAQQRQKIMVLTKFIPRTFTTQLLKEHKFRWEGTRGVLWHYDELKGMWTANGEDTVRHILRMEFDTLEDSMKKRGVIEEILTDLMQCCYEPEGLPESPLHLIPCQNGVYNLDNGEIMPYSSEMFFTWTLPWKYDENAEADFLCKLIDDTLPEGRNITLYELLGYCLWRGYPVQRFWVLVGPGGNGKGVTMTIYTRLLGTENISCVTLDDIQNSRFAAADLYRKLANISGEVSYTDLENTRLLKSLTGGDLINADRKYLSPVRFLNHAKLIFSTNSVPVSRDTTDAFYRRAHIIEFPRRFDINPEIDVKLREDSPYMTRQYEGLLKLTIDNLQRLRDKGFRFTFEPTIESSKAIYQRLSNPLARFIQENCDTTHEHGDFIYKYEFHERLNEWLKIHGFMTMSPEKIGKDMKELGIEQGKRGSPDGDKQYYSYCGLKWSESKGKEDGVDGYFTTLRKRTIEKVAKYPDYPSTPAAEVIEVLGVIE